MVNSIIAIRKGYKNLEKIKHESVTSEATTDMHILPCKSANPESLKLCAFLLHFVCFFCG